MKASRKYVILAVVVVAGVLAATVANQPKYWPDPIVRRWLLDQAPIGTDHSEVKFFLDRRGWRDSTSSLGTLADLCPDLPRVADIPELRLRADLGDTRFILKTGTEAFFAFDSSGKLTGLCVRSDTDGP